MRLFFNTDGSAAGGAVSGGVPAASPTPPAATAVSAEGVSGGAAANGTNPPTQTGTAAPASTEWFSNFSDPDLKGFAERKGFKSPEVAIKGYQELERALGTPQDRLIRLPEKMDAKTETEIFGRLGRPADAKDYKIALPEGETSAELSDWARGAFHESNLTQAQADKFTAKWNDYVKNHLETVERSAAAKSAEQEASLKREWGAAFDDNLKQAKAAAQAFGLKPEFITKLENSIGSSTETLKFLQAVGAKVGEDSFVNNGTRGASFSRALSPDAARNEIQALSKDQNFVTRYTSGDREAFQRMTQLQEWANAGNNS